MSEEEIEELEELKLDLKVGSLNRNYALQTQWANLIEKLQQENQQLKKANDYLQNIIQEYKNPPRYSEIKIDNLKLRQEKEQLKEKYLGAVADYETTKSENQQLKEENENLNHIIDKQDRDITTISKGNKRLNNGLDEIKEYVIKHRQIYDIDGSIEKQIDEFDVLASPKRILQMIDKVKENE